METVGAKYGLTPQTRGERFVGEVRRARTDLRGERANYDRPLDGKSIQELNLPDYKAATGFVEATKRAFPEDTQFTTKVRRSAKYEFAGDDAAESEKHTEIPTANVSHRFVKGGMTGEINRNFYRHKAGDLVASHDGFVINGEDIGKRVLKTQFDEYERMGVKKVTVHANIDVGGCAWARFGFVPKQQFWNRMRKSFKDQMNAEGSSAPGKRRTSEALKDLTPKRKRDPPQQEPEAHLEDRPREKSRTARSARSC